MSEYYNPKRKADWNYGGPKWRLSRSKLELFLDCPRCFYLDNKLGLGRPKGYPFNLNSAVDHLLKKEFDGHRRAKTAHPLMSQYGIEAVPFEHPQMDHWRDSLKGGIEFVHPKTGLRVCGGVDDVWVNPKGELHIVDYKATAKDGEVGLDAEWQRGYKNQMEIYQWLFRQNGFKVSDTGYFVYVNGRRDLAAFDGKLEFDVKVIPYAGDDRWVEEKIVAAKRCLDGVLPEAGEDCDYCRYRAAAREVEGGQLRML